MVSIENGNNAYAKFWMDKQSVFGIFDDWLIGIALHDRGVLGVTKKKLARRAKVLLGLAIEKSNIEADLMQIDLPGSEN